MQAYFYSALVAGLIGVVSCTFASAPVVATTQGTLLDDEAPVLSGKAGALTLQPYDSTVTASASLDRPSTKVRTVGLPVETSAAVPPNFTSVFLSQASEPDWSQTFTDELYPYDSNYFLPLAVVSEKATWVTTSLVAALLVWRTWRSKTSEQS